MSTIFISYASQDRETARVIAGSLEAHGHTVWWDRTIPPGRVFDEVIQEALAAARCVVVLWSANSVRSNWVKVEAEEAAARGLLVPALIEHVTPPIQFKRIQSANLSDWRGDENDPEFRNLLGAIQSLLGRPATTVAPQRVMRSAPAGFADTVRTVAWSVGATLAIVALVWAYRSWTTQDASVEETPPAATESRASREGNADGAVPAPGRPSNSPETVSAPDRRGELVNLLASENGGEMITAQDPGWVKAVDGDENSYLFAAPSEAVFGFKDGRSAILEGVEILIPGASPYNVRELELLTSTDGPEGPFRSIQIFTTKNMLIVKERYQRTLFAARTARYVKVRALSAHTSGAAPLIYEWRLLGTLQ